MMEFFKKPLEMLANQLKLNVIITRKVKIHNDWFGRNIVSPYSRLYYVKSGGGVLITENKPIYLQGGHIYLIPVGKRISYEPNGDMEKLFVHFNIPKPNGYDLLRDFNEIGIIEADNDYIEKIYSLFDSKYISDYFLFESYIKYDIARFIEKYGITLKEYRPYSPKIKKAMEMIQNNLSINLNLEKIANELFISESTLAKQFKKETGVTIGKYIDQMIFYDAQIMLIESNKTIEEISQYYGFCDRFYFSKRFKQLFDSTPAQYRRRMRLKDT